jgi:hypothetical protein
MSEGGVTKGSCYNCKKVFSQDLIAVVAQVVVFLVVTLWGIRSLILLFQRNVLLPSSGRLSLIEVVGEVTDRKELCCLCRKLARIIDTFSVPIISASMCSWRLLIPLKCQNSFLFYRMLQPRRLIF